MMPPNSPPGRMKATAAFAFNDLQLMRKEKVMSIGDKKYLITEPVKETPLEALFRQFLQEKQFLQNIAPNTHDLYARAFSTFAIKAIPTQAMVNQTVVALREQGMTLPTLNAYGRCINVFLNWLVANKHTNEPVKVKRLKCVERSMKTLTDAQTQALLAHRPNTKGEARLIALISLLADAGLRINEALNLSRKDIDFANCLIDIVGKGGKFRRIPISLECRKVLYRYSQSHNFDLVF
jgi:site-specific recombinase XerD